MNAPRIKQFTRAAALMLPLLLAAALAQHFQLYSKVAPAYYKYMGVALIAVTMLSVLAAWIGSRTGKSLLPFVLTGVLLCAGVSGISNVWIVPAFILLSATSLAISTLLPLSSACGIVDRFLVGMAIIVAIVGWTLPFKFHYQWLYISISLVVIGLRFNQLRSVVQSSLQFEWADFDTNWVWYGIFAALISVPFIGLFMPTVGYDDNAGHLVIATQLLFHERYNFDVGTQIWALAPWANNVLNAWGTVVIQDDGRALTGIVWLIIGITGVYRLARQFLSSPLLSLAVSVAYASLPFTTYFATTLQVDGASAALYMYLATITVQLFRTQKFDVWVAGAILALMAGLKLPNVIYAAPFVLAIFAHRILDGDIKSVFKMVLLTFLLGCSSYTYSWVVTGSPFFPLYNEFFKSPYYPLENFHDSRWSYGVRLSSPFQITYLSDKFGEFGPGATGLTLLGSSAGLCFLLFKRRSARWLAAAFLFATFVMFLQIQYLRYIFAGIVGLTSLGVIGWAIALKPRGFLSLVVAAALLNMALIPTTSWLLNSEFWPKVLTEPLSSQKQLTRAFNPERAVLLDLDQRQPGGCVLMATADPFIAGYEGYVNGFSWYDPTLQNERERLDQDKSANAWMAFIREDGFTNVVTRGDDDAVLELALRKLQYRATPLISGITRWDSPKSLANCDTPFRRERDKAAQLVPSFAER